MKYIGSGLWAIAAAYLEVSGGTYGPTVFAAIAFSIALFGSNKSLVTINNQATVVKDGE